MSEKKFLGMSQGEIVGWGIVAVTFNALSKWIQNLILLISLWLILTWVFGIFFLNIYLGMFWAAVFVSVILVFLYPWSFFIFIALLIASRIYHRLYWGWW